MAKSEIGGTVYTSGLNPDVFRHEGSTPSSPTKYKMKIYGPYKRLDDRKHIVIVYDDGRKVTKSYPRHLMEIFLGRELSTEETVDHINGDKTDDRIENLQILSRSDNIRKSTFKTYYPDIKCGMCGKEFKPSKNQIVNRKNTAGPFCSRPCAGRYSTLSHHNKIPPMPNVLVGTSLHKRSDDGKVKIKKL